MPQTFCTAFISSTTRDLKSYRQMVADTLRNCGIQVVIQEHFGADSRTIREIVHQAIEPCDAVICLIGKYFGQAPADEPERSYTQLEFDIAQSLGKPVFRFIASEEYLPDHPSDQSPHQEELQEQHRQAVTECGHRWDLFATKEQLRELVYQASLKVLGDQKFSAAPRVNLLPDRIRAATEHFVHQSRESHVFDPQSFVQRLEALSHVTAFQEGPASGMFLLGASGTGKSCFVTALAARWLEDAEPHRLVLALRADSLPAPRMELLNTIAHHLGLTLDQPLEASLVQLEQASGGKLRVLVILDGLDRHPYPLEVLNGVRELIRCFSDSQSFRLLATCTLNALEDLSRRRGFPLDREHLYQPNRGLVAEGNEAAPPGYVLGDMTEEELAEAYNRYRQQPATAPLTPFAELSEDARQALSSPIFLRIAMEVYSGKSIRRVFSAGEMVQAYAAKKIFDSPAYVDFVGALADLMLETHRQSLPLQDLFDHPRLRPALLDHSTNSPLVHCRNEQIVSIGRNAGQLNLPLPPEEFIEFSFQSLLEYLLMWRLSVKHRQSSQAISEAALEKARVFQPMRGTALLILRHLALSRQYEVIVPLLQKPDPWQRDLLQDLFVELFESDPIAARELVRDLAKPRPLALAETLSRTGEALFLRGRWTDAREALSAAAEIPGLEAETSVRLQNRLVLLCKNEDQWTMAMEHSDHCLKNLNPRSSSELQSRVYLNRGSVLYDRGERPAAAEAFQRALGLAGSPIELAAALNDLGIYHHYHDELDLAETALRRGLHSVSDWAAGYLETNLGLVLMTRALSEPSHLVEAAQIFEQVLERFVRAGHLQGISYALSNRAICYLAQGKFADVKPSFEKTIRLARQMPEKWSAYGAQANLALLHLAEPEPDRQAAWDLATSVREQARENGDPKGVADASLIAGRAALDLVKQGNAIALVPQVRELLQEAAAIFSRLGQRLGGGQALLGLAELADLVDEVRQATDFRQQAQELFEQAQQPCLPPRLQPLPWHMLLLMELF